MRTGTGVMSIYQNLVQARGTVTAQQELYRLGLLDPEDGVVQQPRHAEKGETRRRSAVRRSSSQEGPASALLQKTILPAFAKHGITGDEAVIRELGMILGNRTGSSLMSRIYQHRETIAMQSSANCATR